MSSTEELALVRAELGKNKQALANNAKSNDVRENTKLVYQNIRLLNDYFGAFLSGSPQMSDHERGDSLIYWSKEISDLADIDPISAFLSARQAFTLCTQGTRDKLIANTVCVNVNMHAMRALLSRIKKEKHISSDDINSYIIPLKDVIRSTAPHHDSPNLMNTFYEALSAFEDMLLSHFVSPVVRFQHVMELKLWAQNNQYPCDALLQSMNELLQDASYLPDGRGEILHVLERQANTIAEETKKHAENCVSDIQSAFAIRAGVSPEYQGAHRSIEDGLRSWNFDKTEGGLYNLFQKLFEDHEDGVITQKEISTLSYWGRTLQRLYHESKVHAFHLVENCIHAIENQMLHSEYLQATVYGAGLPIISTMELSDSKYTHRAVEMYKIIMKRSSEFCRTEDADDIFECAAIGFRLYLGTISPFARYNEVSELAIWLGSRKVKAPNLEEFVDDLMNSVQSYGKNWGISLEEDNSATNHGFLPNQP